MKTQINEQALEVRGWFPKGGVTCTEAINAQCGIVTSDPTNCKPLFFRGSCNEFIDASVINALVSELINVINLVPAPSQEPYDCTRLDNVARNLKLFVGGSNPAGMVSAFYRDTPPKGWLICDGKSYDQATYPILAEAMGVAPGETITLPDLRGEFIRGWIETRSDIPSEVGRGLGSTEQDTFKAHNHIGTTTEAGEHYHTIPWVLGNADGGNSGRGNAGGTTNTSAAGKHTHNVIINNTGDQETRPRNVALLYCIFTGQI